MILSPIISAPQDTLDQIVLGNSTMFATLSNGQPLKIQRLRSGPFILTVPSNGQVPPSEILPTVPPGSYKSAASGFWVYLPAGAEAGHIYTPLGRNVPERRIHAGYNLQAHGGSLTVSQHRNTEAED